MEGTQLKKKQLDELIRVWKRAALLCNDYIIRGDIWIPAQRTAKSRPGRHILEGPPCSSRYANNIYLAKNLTPILKDLSERKGLKQIVFYRDDRTIGFDLNTGSVIVDIAHIDTSEQEFPCNWNSFDEIVKSMEWIPITTSQLEDIRDGNRVELTDGMYHVVITRNHFKYSGVVSASREINYTASFSMQYPIIDELAPAMLYILVDYGFFRCCHTYAFMRYEKPDYNTIKY